MQMLHSRRTYRRFIYSPIAIILLIVVCVLVWRGVWTVYQKEAQSRHVVEQLALQHAALQDRQMLLEERVQTLQTHDGMITEIREKFDVVKEGERVAVIVDPEDTAMATSTMEAPWFRTLWQKITQMW